MVNFCNRLFECVSLWIICIDQLSLLGYFYSILFRAISENWASQNSLLGHIIHYDRAFYSSETVDNLALYHKSIEAIKNVVFRKFQTVPREKPTFFPIYWLGLNITLLGIFFENNVKSTPLEVVKLNIFNL